MSSPLISIKKPDGTFVKVTMAEFLAIKKQETTSTPPPANLPVQNAPMAAVEPAKQAPPVPAATKHATPTTHHHTIKTQHPVHIKTHAEQEKSHATHPLKTHHTQPHHKPLTSADARSPLEEKIAVKSSAPLTSTKRESQVEEVVRKLAFGVPADLLGRLKSLVLARLKDIKSEDEVREVLLRSIKSGGLGLAAPQAERLISTTREIHKKHISQTTVGSVDVPILKGKPSMALMVEPPELPAVATDVTPKPYNEVYKEVERTPQSTLVPSDDIVSKLVKESMASEPIFKISSKSTPKHFVQDISAPEVEMGPVDEIRSINLLDFRRLSGNPGESAKRLQQKMSNLQQESFVWYLDALAAYHNSPLYLEYIQAVCESLAERKSLANVLMMKNSIKLSEVMAIVEMERSL